MATPVQIVLVRHAEKVKGEDPGLTAAGLVWARSLIKLREVFAIKAVYTSDTKRAKMTGEPLAQTLKMTSIQYKVPIDDEKLLADFASQYGGGTVVLVGHSNTIPQLINKAIGESAFANIDEGDFSNLFLLHYNPNGKSRVLQYRYSSEKDLLILEPKSF